MAKKHLNKAPAANTKNVSAKDKKSSGKTTRIVIVVIAAAVVFCIALILLTAFGVIRMPGIGEDSISIGLTKNGDTSATSSGDPAESGKPDYLDPEGMSDEEIQAELEDLLAPVDADAYYDEIGTVTQKIPANTADIQLSESDTRKLMDERNFTDITITSNYDSEGKYYQEEKTWGSSSTTHPCYRAIYVDNQNRTWVLNIYHSAVYAQPIEHSVEHPDSAIIYLSESDTLTGYDSDSNSYYEFIPESDFADLRKVDKIDAAALDSFIL